MKERSRDTFLEEISDDDVDDVNGGVEVRRLFTMPLRLSNYTEKIKEVKL